MVKDLHFPDVFFTSVQHDRTNGVLVHPDLGGHCYSSSFPQNPGEPCEGRSGDSHLVVDLVLRDSLDLLLRSFAQAIPSMGSSGTLNLFFLVPVLSMWVAHLND